MEYRLQDTLKFGCHKGRTLEDVITSDPQYVDWARVHIKWFKLSPDAKQFLTARISEIDDITDDFEWGGQFIW